MIVLGSLRKKLVYTFLGSALVTVLLFSLVIRAIANEYFQRLSEARLTFVEEQGKQAVRQNLAIFKDRMQQMFSAGTVALNSMGSAGSLGDQIDVLVRSEAQRTNVARHLQLIQAQTRLSLITLIDANGRTVLRTTNPSQFGDDALMRDYQNAAGPVSSLKHLVDKALKGQTVSSFSVLAPEILAPENALEGGKSVSSLKDASAILLKGKDVAPETYETRALALTMAAPVLDSKGTVVGALIAARIVNKDTQIVQDVRNLLGDQASIFLGQVRVATTLKGKTSGIGYAYRDQTRTSIGLYNEHKGRVDGEALMGVFDPIMDFDGLAVGSLYLGRPLSFMDDIATAQADVEVAVERRTTYFIIGLVGLSMLLAVVIASIFSRRITGQIDTLRRGAETISDGNLDFRLDIRSGDEIQLLAQQFNSMAAKLQDSYQTLEKKVEERTRELKESQEAMAQQEKMVGVGQLAAGIAHELNTPLGTIIGYAQMLREDLAMHPLPEGTPSGTLTDVDEIIEQAGRCRDLVKNLLNFSRRSTTEKTSADINVIIRKILSLTEHDFEIKRVTLRLNLDAGLPRVRVNENEIAQVVLNLTNNAADSMPDGGEIVVTTRHVKDTDRVCIEVSDHGSGITETDRKRVFEPFFTTKEVGKGTGLGLSICYKIIENHLGTMEFDSVAGEGTTFRVYIPVNGEVRVA